ncbi:MAG: bifunctional phosphopantothenoylcysteine decarboxylase/phosphopantothenate--cysteine ligase CoaBC [Rhodospirillales bacterium]|jgi:phosphopantothenoylcysteine decarboxylase/phosphopantothenate--cysteine ligase|nr:bifunctional phosphopantothenoylcysteine decarboxylase/phosphopantothenate--cysteine ligase CoaBC [Rhodospirillales bacterium]
MLDGKSILLVVTGGIAAYKCLEVIRRVREKGARVRCILTRGGANFVTPLALGALSEDRVFQDLFSLTDEHEIGHIRLSREADVVLVAPASANVLAKMAAGQADDLATTALLATDKPIMVAPAMNPAMWAHPATRANMAILEGRGVHRVGPTEGAMAESGEWGLGRMAEPDAIVAALESLFGGAADGLLKDRRALVTSGPTHEAIDPVRYLANRSSGKQGHAVATALARLGAATTLVSGPTHQPAPAGVHLVRVETAREMLDACLAALPVDVAVMAAAVADWRPADAARNKLKKPAKGGKSGGKSAPPALKLVENPDILATLGGRNEGRPQLVVGFAAETDAVVENAVAKRRAKGCDWLVANDVSAAAATFGGDDNQVHLITADGVEEWPKISKSAVAERLAQRIAETLEPA